MYIKEDVERICANLTYHRNKYLFRLTNNSSWNTNPKFLKDESFSESFYCASYSLKGSFNSYNTKFFAIDIDDHENNDFERLRIIYNKVVDILGPSSFTCKSPNGLHMYYLLNDYCNCYILVSGVSNLLSQSSITKNLEVKPTSNVGLRFPNYNYILSPKLDYFIDVKEFEFGNFLDNCNHYQAFNFIQTQEKVLYKKSTYVEETTIKKGCTNDALNHYIPLWRGLGYSLNEVVNMFYNKLDPSYNGELRNIDRIRYRASFYYKKDGSYVYESFKKDETDYESKYPNIFKAVINTYLTYSKTNSYNQQLRIKSIKEDLTTVLKIYDNNNRIREDKELFELHSYKNPFYKYELSRGCYPIFSKSIKRNNLLLFMDLGLLSLPYGRHYSKDIHSCIYYCINMEFIVWFIKNVVFNFYSKFLFLNSFIYFNMFLYRVINNLEYGAKISTGPPKFQLY